MEVKKSFLIICLILFIFSIASVSASDVNATDSGDEILSVSAVDSDSIDLIDEYNQTNTTDELLGISIDEKDIRMDGVIGAAMDEEDLLGANLNFGDLNTLFNKPTGQDIDGEGDYTATNSNDPPVLATSNHIIDGHGGTWDRTSSYTKRILSISNGVSNLVFKNITFKNGHVLQTTYYGGAINFAGNNNNITFINCTFESNYIDNTGANAADHNAHGGAIYFAGSATDINFLIVSLLITEYSHLVMIWVII